MFKEKVNPYNFLSNDWYVYNDYVDLLDRYVKADYISQDRASKNFQFFIGLEADYLRDYYYLELVSFADENLEVVPRSDINVLTDVLLDLKAEVIPTFLYFLQNDKTSLPDNFNALTYPQYFEILNTKEESIQSRQAYNQILKKTLDARNNNLDARKLNTGLNAEDVATIAQRVETDSNSEKRRDINFSPNSLVNAKVGSESVVDSVKLQREKERALKEEEQRIKLKFLKNDDNKPTTTRMSLEDLLKEQNSDKNS